MRLLRCIRLCLAGIVIGSASAVAADVLESPDRFAYVIGNSAYETFGGDKIEGSPFNLVTPANDARQYADALARLGWTVLNEARVERATEAIRRELEAALNQITPGSEVVFVFSGHGFSINDTNFIVGIPASGESYASVEEMVSGSIPIDYIVERLDSRDPSRIILIINACGDQPLLDSVGTAPARVSYPNVGAEVLILYSSSPRGVAYDFIDSQERATRDQEENLNSLFTRSFLKQIEEDQPLLAAFTNARIETERLSLKAAAFRGLPPRSHRQIPHIVHDTINGRFNLFDPSATLIEASQSADWRLAPSSCRVNENSLNEALALRDASPNPSKEDLDALRACILQAGLQDLGVDKITFDGARGGVVFSSVSADSAFKKADLVNSISIVRVDGAPDRVTLRDLNQFQEVLYENVRRPGTTMYFTRVGAPETGGGSSFVIHEY
ncbi:caspase family protein [uncultured Roseobacter sp.]|uniref:caspase family protein n=1 Tax=uncultured Roseobacter sp. TaxID=114847 RepID=UPI0026179E61|nr:caspase family protein [uncultured Roseobacter sp.]